MQFTKGQSGNPSGRPKGSQNKAATTLRERITALLEDRFEQLSEDLDSLDPKDRLKVYTDLLQYGLPKLQSIATTPNFDQMTEQELDRIIEELKAHAS
jgi:predicted component of type VI protein secretion system